MNAARVSSRLRQKGMATVIGVIFLITAVIFALSQTLDITGSNSIDDQKYRDSVAALFLAESGLEKAQSVLTNAAQLNNSVCAGIASSGFSLGDGSVTLSGTSVAAGADPNAACDFLGGTACKSCTVLATGTVRSASRTLMGSISLTSDNGTAGIGTKAKMTLRNTYANPVVAVFNLATRRVGGETDTVCNTVTTRDGGQATCSM